MHRQSRDFRSFIVHLVCMALLLQGPPLMALEQAGPRGFSEPSWLAELPWPDVYSWIDAWPGLEADLGSSSGSPSHGERVGVRVSAVHAGAPGTANAKPPPLPLERKGRKARSEETTPRPTGRLAPDPRPRKFPGEPREITKSAIAPEIVALAEELEHAPVGLYNFVHDQIELDLRWGAYRSSIETLRERRGTAWDQAALLKELLAAGGVDARFEWGEIEIIPQVLTEYAGVGDPWRAGDLLTTAGVPMTLLIQGDEVIGARIQHVWLRAWIDYSPNRGALAGPGDHWVPVDPVLKHRNLDAGQRLDEEVPFDLGSYFGSGTELSPLAAYEEALRSHLDGASLDGVKPVSTTRPAKLPFLPATWKGWILRYDGTEPEIPAEFQQRLEIELRDGNGRELLRWSTTGPALAGRRFEIAWPGATDADQATLELYGSVFAAPPFEVELMPVLRLAGTDVATGEAIGSAEDVAMLATFTAPGRGTKAVAFELLAGEPAAFVSGRAAQQTIDASEGLAKAAALYAEKLHADLAHLAGLRGQVLVPLDVVALAVQRGARSLAPDGTPLTFSPGPRTVDLGALQVGLFPADGVWRAAEVSRATLELLGAQGAHLEGEAIVEVFGDEPLTAVGLLTRAAREGQTLLRVDSSNVGAALSQVSLSTEAENAVRQGIEQGRIAWIHEEQLPFETWQTSGYVLEDPQTGAAGFFVTFERVVEAIEGLVEFHAPLDLDVVTAPTDVVATIDAEQLSSWTLAYRPAGERETTVIATGSGPVQDAVLGQLDPTLLLNGLYDLVLTGTDAAGQQLTGKISVSVEGNMKIGHFTLSFVDLAIPVSGLDVEVIRTYDSRQRQIWGDFGPGWSLDIRQGSYRNNRPPGDGWQFQAGFLPCDSIIETKSHVTTIRLSDREIYRFRLKLSDGASTQGGCFAEASFEFVDGPLPGSRLEIVGNSSVFYENGGDRVIDAETFEVFVPEDVLLTTRDGRIFELDLEDGVTRLEDLNGNELRITPEGITHSSGRGVEFERDAEDRIIRVTDPLGQSLTYEYSDGGGDLVIVTERDGAITHFTYLEDHLLDEIMNPLGVRAVKSEYDENGRLVRMTDADGKALELEHDLDARREVIRNRLGFTRVLEYGERGNVVREIDELGKVTLRAFDAKDRLLSETDPLGNTTTNAYDANGDLVSTTDPLGNVTRLAYNDFGSPTSITNPRGAVTRFGYDSQGNLTSTTDPLGALTSFTYDRQGHLLAESDPLGNVTRFAYDEFGNQVKTTDALGTETTTTHNANGHVTSQSTSRTLPDGATEILTTTFVVDELGRITSTTLPDGSTSSTTYDALGAVLSATDALGRVTAVAYDGSGRQTATTYPDGTTERREYDAEGRLLAVADRAGRLTTFLYDAAGRLLATTLPDGSTTSSSYDEAGRLVASTDARGATTTYVHDAAGRRVQVIDALGNATTFSFDAAGNQVRATDALGNATTFEHDAAGRLVSTTLPDGTSTASEYDALGRRVAEVDPAGRRTVFSFDPLGRLVEVKDALDHVTRYAYDEQSSRISQTDANSHTTRFTYDPLGRQTGRILPDGARESFAFDAVGNLVHRTDFNGAVTNHAFDVNDRLVRRDYPDGSSVSFTYTPTGRRETVTDARGVTTFAYKCGKKPLFYMKGAVLRDTFT